MSLANQHLAILLPKHLWKPDSLASRCDNFYCSVSFSLLERRHHCRKCGGVFCASCSSRSTPLLDASNLDFLQPPKNIPLSSFESPISPIYLSRVCDDCWDQLHGLPSTPRTPDFTRPPSLSRILTSPISMLTSPPSSSMSSPNSSLPSSVGTPSPDSVLSNTLPITRRKSPSLRTTSSVSSLNGSRRSLLRNSHLNLPPELDRSYGELDAYPLRRSSVLCKATGGGRWEPKPDTPVIGYRPPIPGAKAQFELQMEQEERTKRIRRENPVVKDGDFQYRFFSPHLEPLVLSRSPYTMSTF